MIEIFLAIGKKRLVPGMVLRCSPPDTGWSSSAGRGDELLLERRQGPVGRSTGDVCGGAGR